VSVADVISMSFPFPEPMANANSAALSSMSSEPSENVGEGNKEDVTSIQTHGQPDDQKPDQSQVRTLKRYLRCAKSRSHIQHWRFYVQCIRVTILFLYTLSAIEL